jgi:peptidoglycan/LPS O-acetylase OafA/YrhL
MKLSYFTEGKDNNFNLIRMVAACVVLVEHSFALAIGFADARPFRISSSIDMSSLAVDVFFVTSGFLVTSSLLRRQHPIEFVWARVLRIYPALLVMQFLTVFGLGLCFTTLPWTSYLASYDTFKYWVKGSILFTGLVPTLPGIFENNPLNNVFNSPLWTLPYELGMYATLVGVWVAISLVPRVRLRIFTIAIVGCATVAVLLLLSCSVCMTHQGQLLRLFGMFFSGAAVYVLKDRIVLSGPVFWSLMVVVPLATILGEHVLFAAYVLALPYILLYLAYIPSGFIRKYNHLGDYSYGVYIYAWPVQQSIASLVPGISVPAMLLVSASVNVALAALSWHLIEQRVLQLKSVWVGYMKSSREVAWTLGGLIGAVLLLKSYHTFQEWQVQPVPVSRPARAEVSHGKFGQEGKRTMVALVFGEGNAANEGETPRVANGRVFNVFLGRLFHAEDPLLGSAGHGGSIWTRLGDQLIERNLYDEVVFAPMAVSAGEIARWRPGGDLHRKLIQRIRAAKWMGLTFTHLLWHQGKSDTLNKTTKAAYQDAFHAMLDSIRKEGVSAPVYVSVTSRCWQEEPNQTIQSAQTELVDYLEKIYEGLKMDRLGPEYRYDGCYFTDEGLERAASLWLEVLTRSPRDPSPH